MKKFESIPHTADIRLKVSGTTQEELFSAALQGLANLIKKNKKTDVLTEAMELKIKSPDMTSLLIDFLSEVLTAFYTKKVLFYDINFSKLNNNELHATIIGVKITYKKLKTDIKAVTYHEANIHKNSAGDLETIIVFDV